VLQAPEEVAEEEQERLEAAVDAARERRAELETAAREEEERGASWGMDDDEGEGPAGGSTSAGSNGAGPQGEAFYIEDPKKALRTFFDREVG
jgi:hypothetical protein